MDMKLEIKKASCGYGNKAVVKEVSMTVGGGEVLCLLGPNGVGKTTLFKSILGFLPLQSGKVLIDGKDMRKLSRKQIAKVIGYIPQAHTPPFPFSVLDVVVMGRMAHQGMLGMPSKKDLAIAEENLEKLHITYLKDKIYTQISGGERQMVLIARALTQNPKILIMDEPTSNLDFGNQMRLLEQVNELASKGLGIVMTSHFPDHAFLCSTKVALLEKGSFKIGKVEDIITERNLQSAYGIPVKIGNMAVCKGQSIKCCVPLLEHFHKVEHIDERKIV